MATCEVSYVDSDGVRHSVEVDADGLYEAASLALRTFDQLKCAPGIASPLKVEVRSVITHTLTVRKVHDWVTGGAKSLKEKILKERLRTLINIGEEHL